MSAARRETPIFMESDQPKLIHEYNSSFWQFEEDRWNFDDEVDETTESSSPLKEGILSSQMSEKMSSSCMSNTGKLSKEERKLILEENLSNVSKEQRSNSYKDESNVIIVTKSEQKVASIFNIFSQSWRNLKAFIQTAINDRLISKGKRSAERSLRLPLLKRWRRYLRKFSKDISHPTSMVKPLNVLLSIVRV